MSYQQWVEGETAPWAKVNENNDALGQAYFGTPNKDAHSGLTVGINGGNFDETTVADDTLACTDDDTNYIVCHRASPAFTVAITTTNWDDTATYGRVARAVFASGVLTWHDERDSPGGIFDHASAGGSGTVTNTGGNLTANAVVLGAGTVDTKVVAGITTDGTSKMTLGVAGTSVGSVDFKNATSGTITVAPPTGALGTVTLTLPAATDTLVGKATADTLTNKTLTSPTMTAPVLGTPASGNLSSCTADGTNAVGFRGIPQNAQTGNYTLVAADAGKHIYHASGAGAGDTYTIPANGSVAYAIGTSVTFVNMATDAVSIAITTDTMYLAGAGTAGTRTLAQFGVATAVKVDSTVWVISGTGLT